MFNDKAVYAFIPARGGSKGIPRKNLYRLGNDTLLERTIKLAKLCPYVDYVVVSTDDVEMHNVAKRYEVNAPTLRPPHLATDTAKTIDVVLHLIGELQIQDVYVLLLQTTSPLRTLDDLNRFFRTFEQNIQLGDAIVSITPHDTPHPDKIQKIENDYVGSYLGVEAMVPRQSLPQVYSLNGAFYLTDTDILIHQRTFLPKRTIPFVMPRERSINLDDKLGLLILEALLEKGIVTLEEYP